MRRFTISATTMKTPLSLLLIPALLCGVPLLSITASAQTNAFTYQGRLTDNSAAANGSYDIRFTLHSVATGGTALGTQTVNPVILVNGLFSASLDFGAA